MLVIKLPNHHLTTKEEKKNANDKTTKNDENIRITVDSINEEIEPYKYTYMDIYIFSFGQNLLHTYFQLSFDTSFVSITKINLNIIIIGHSIHE